MGYPNQSMTCQRLAFIGIYSLAYVYFIILVMKETKIEIEISIDLKLSDKYVV